MPSENVIPRVSFRLVLSASPRNWEKGTAAVSAYSFSLELKLSFSKFGQVLRPEPCVVTCAGSPVCCGG
eukprot:2952706-Rhodomonas_salina.1